MKATDVKEDQCPTCEHGEAHFYGGQAVIEGVMMRGLDRYAVAIRREDGEIVLAEKNIVSFSEKHRWAKWPLFRGNVMLVEGVTLGYAGLQFSADILAQEENERLAAEKAAAAAEARAAAPDDAEEPVEAAPETDPSAEAPEAEPEQAAGLGPWLMTLTTLLATALAVGLFILLPTWAVDWFAGKGEGASYGDSVVRNVSEGGVRLVVLVLYILAISRMEYIRRVFQYHGAEHAAINCFEAGEPVNPANILRYSQLHPRCGTAFLLVVIVIKIILGCFFGWPVLWLRMLIRLALLPLVAGLGYEVIRWAGRHRNSVFSKILAAPGMLMQVLTTRQPDELQAVVAMYSLAAVAEEVDLPEGYEPARRLPIPLHSKKKAQEAQQQTPSDADTGTTNE